MLNFTKKITLVGRAIQHIDNWIDYLLDYFGLKRGTIIYRINNKLIKTRAGTIDKSIITELVLEDKYFPKWLKLDKNATVIDLGAHIGIFSVLINRKVYAIEPSKENFNLLKEQIRLNKSPIIPFKIAISEKKGTLKLYGGTHSARFSIVRQERSNFEIVETDTLKNFFKKNKVKKCDLLKIDVEGAEYSILYNTPKEIFRCIDRIVMEIHRIEGQDRKNLAKFIKNKGFNIYFNSEEGFLWALKPEIDPHKKI